MKHPLEVLRMKEEEILRVKREIEALKVTARLLSDREHAPEKRPDHRQPLQMP